MWQDIKTSATGSPYRLTSVAVDRSFGRNWLSLGMSRLEEKQSLLGGRMSNVLGGGGSTSLFLDAEARHDFGKGLSASLTARRGWTDFAAGKFQTGAYAFDLAKIGVLGGNDRLGFRFAQPLRVEHGGFAMWLPTSYDYATGTATSSLSTHVAQPERARARRASSAMARRCSAARPGSAAICSTAGSRDTSPRRPTTRARRCASRSASRFGEGQAAAPGRPGLRRLKRGVSIPTSSR